jgi:excisionase family DNA binding protein
MLYNTTDTDLPKAVEEILVKLEVINKQIQSAILSEPTDTNLMDSTEAAKLLHIAKSTLYNKLHAGKIPHLKFGGKLLFKRSSLMEFLENNKVRTAEQIRTDTETEVDLLLDTAFRNRRKKKP